MTDPAQGAMRKQALARNWAALLVVVQGGSDLGWAPRSATHHSRECVRPEVVTPCRTGSHLRELPQ